MKHTDTPPAEPQMKEQYLFRQDCEKRLNHVMAKISSDTEKMNKYLSGSWLYRMLHPYGSIESYKSFMLNTEAQVLMKIVYPD